MSFDWQTTSAALDGFGGRQVQLTIPKTGLPFFDALQLYGSIDLYIGLREDVSIRDLGSVWSVQARVRDHRLKDRDINAFRQVWSNKRPLPEQYCSSLREAVEHGKPFLELFFVDGRGDWDPSLQDGIRSIAARQYSTLQSGQTSKNECKAQIPLSNALLAAAGRARTQGVGNIVFLPIFEGKIDLSRVVSPLWLWVATPNVSCAQALVLLALRTSLFAEGYQDRLSAVVFRTSLGSKRSDNFSGVIAIRSTAVGQAITADLMERLYQVMRALVNSAWTRRGATPLVTDALAMAYWLMHPLPKHLSAFLTSQERLHRDRKIQVFVSPEYVREVFEMSFGNWQGDHESVRRFARAVSSGIWWARRGLTPEDQRKKWYDEVTMLRSAPSAKAFIERAMILIEQGHREHSQIGTRHRDEAFDPAALLSSLGNDRSSFEAFRDLFRMYLVQESTYQPKQMELSPETEETSVELSELGGVEETE